MPSDPSSVELLPASVASSASVAGKTQSRPQPPSTDEAKGPSVAAAGAS